jgi:hypothetical protein
MLSASALITSDTMLDSGANHIFFPSYHSHYMSQFKPNNNNDRVTVANGQTLAITGSAFLGPFHILIAPGLHKPLISESYLTTRFDILIVRYDEITWLIDAFKARNYRNTDPTDYVIARANIEDDGLYYITNILDLAYATPKPRQRVRFPTANHVSTIIPNTTPIPPLPIAPVTHTRGRYQGRFSHLLHPLNPLEVLKVRLGFPSIQTIKNMVRDLSVHGLGVTYHDIKHLTVSKSLAEYRGRMTAFPIYPSLTNHSVNQLFETWSVDDVPMPIKSIEGYKGYFSYVEITTKFRHAIGYKQSIAELPDSLNLLIAKFGPRVNTRAKPLRVLILDGSSTNLSDALDDICTHRPNSTDPIIQRHVSAPYKHQQNLIESHIQHEKNGMRTNLTYNKAPAILWFKALKDTLRNINITHAPSSNISRMEAMQNNKPDVSHYVPFYAKGYAFIHPDERYNSTLAHRAREFYMVEYADDLDEQQYTNIQYTNLKL